MLKRDDVVETESLKDRIVQAASRLFSTDGYDGLSMRRVAQEVGCSQMAMYRHFANKEALVQYICADLYMQFVHRIHAEIGKEPDARKKLRQFVRATFRFVERYPDHYSLIFLVRHPDPEVVAKREVLGQNFLAGIAEIVRHVLPGSTSTARVNATLRRMMESLHGAAALWLAHPSSYDLTLQRAIDDVETIWSALLHV